MPEKHLSVPERTRTQDGPVLTAILLELKAIRVLLETGELKPVVEGQAKRPARKAKV